MGWFGSDKISNGELNDLVRLGFQQFLPARVISIDQSENLTNGNVICEVLTPLATLPNQSQISATPLYANNKSYPLINEVVFLITGPSGEYSSNTGKVKYYYLSTLNIWNNVHVNPTPNPYTNLKSDSQDKSIAEIEAGSTNKSGEQDTNQFKPGTYFEEKSNIFPLYPFEGDVIYEGRWGQSIRFGSTNSLTTPSIVKETINKSFGENVNYDLGEVTPPSTFNVKLNLLNSKVGQFLTQYDDDRVSIYIESSESQVTNPNSIPKGELAKTRANNIKTILESYSNLKYNISVSSKVGDIPYTIGIDDPNDIKYKQDQYTTIKVLVQGTKSTPQISTTNPLNSWSEIGNPGDPIFILRNGQNPELQGPAQSTTVENVNKDLSSAYFTSTQKIPIEVSSQNDYLSYGENKPEDPREYTGAQVILNSGRLVFNSTQNHILLSSKKSINLNSVESVNIDAATRTVIQTPELYLGGITTAQPVVLGDDLVGLLTDVLDDLKTLTNSLQNQVGVPVGSPFGPTNLIAQAINSKISGYKTRLKNSLSETTKTV